MPIDWDKTVLAPVLGIFGEAVTYQPASASPFIVNGVFDEAYHGLTPLGRGGLASEAIEWGSPGEITDEMPVLGVRLAEFSIQPAPGDTLIVRGTAYAVKQVRLDGHGGAKLLLNLH